MKKIKNISIHDGYEPFVAIEIEDGTERRLVDSGRDCCAHHYISTDDDLDAFLGSDYQGWDLGEHTTTGDDYIHEIQFLNVRTSTGVIVFSAHNEHNGYYGGFSIAESITSEAK